MTRNRQLQGQRGFSMLEVLVALVILSIGLLALAALQGRLLKNTSDTKARTTAVSIAQGQVDKFRGFQSINSPTAAELSFADIATGVLGGADDPFADGTDLGAEAADSTTIEVGGVTYTPEWTVTDVFWDKTAGNFVTTAPVAGQTAAFKRVDVTVSWPRGELDDEGNAITDQVTLSETIAAVSPSDSARALDEKGVSPSPIVYYTPQPAPEVVRVPTLGLGGDRFKETSKPEPDVLQREVNTVTTFSTITFDRLAENEFQAVRREDTFVVNCICEFDTAGTSVGLAPTIWNGREYVVGEEVPGKTVGKIATGVRGQPDICQTCCRDHHDSADSPAEYDPFRNEEKDASGNHLHYNVEVDNDDNVSYVPADPLGADGAPTEYLEACRFIREDGLVYVTQDFSLTALEVMPEQQLTTGSGLTAYQTYVTDFVTEYLDEVTRLIDSSSYPQQLPDTSTFTASFTPQEVSMSNLNTGQQFLARGIYVDFITDELLDCIKTRRGTVDVSEDTPDECRPAVDDEGNAISDGGFLDIVPFTEVNVTRLANWAWSGDARVTSDPISDGDEATYSRGFATLAASPGNAETSSVQAAIERSNTGLTDTRTIDPDDGDVFPPSEIVLSNNPPADKVRISGNLALGKSVSAVAPSDLRLNGGDIWGCQLVLAERKQDPNTFSCVANKDLLLEAYPEGIASMVLRVANYSKIYSDRQGNTTVTCTEDNQVSATPAEPITLDGILVSNDATDTEFSDATVGNIVLPAEGDGSYTMNLSITNFDTTCT